MITDAFQTGSIVHKFTFETICKHETVTVYCDVEEETITMHIIFEGLNVLGLISNDQINDIEIEAYSHLYKLIEEGRE
tara:strand:- start:910 stop:1143 length:234 start_codon:yes stop_codon:yes gene_type:complete